MGILKLIFKKDKEHEHSYGPVEEDGYQYCVACNYAHYVPKEKPACEHAWEVIDKSNILKKNVYSNEWLTIGRTFILQCKKCGELKKELFSTIDE